MSNSSTLLPTSSTESRLHPVDHEVTDKMDASSSPSSPSSFSFTSNLEEQQPDVKEEEERQQQEQQQEQDNAASNNVFIDDNTPISICTNTTRSAGDQDHDYHNHNHSQNTSHNHSHGTKDNNNQVLNYKCADTNQLTNSNTSTSTSTSNSDNILNSFSISNTTFSITSNPTTLPLTKTQINSTTGANTTSASMNTNTNTSTSTSMNTDENIHKHVLDLSSPLQNNDVSADKQHNYTHDHASAYNSSHTQPYGQSNHNSHTNAPAPALSHSSNDICSTKKIKRLKTTSSDYTTIEKATEPATAPVQVLFDLTSDQNDTNVGPAVFTTTSSSSSSQAVAGIKMDTSKDEMLARKLQEEEDLLNVTSSNSNNNNTYSNAKDAFLIQQQKQQELNDYKYALSLHLNQSSNDNNVLEFESSTAYKESEATATNKRRQNDIAWKFVETVLDRHKKIRSSPKSSPGIEPIATDDMYDVAESMLEFQEQLLKEGSPVEVTLAYHYTKERCVESIAQDGLIESKHGTFGQGVYLGYNACAFHSHGQGPVGLIVAILKGKCERVDMSKYRYGRSYTNSSNGQINTVIGNKFERLNRRRYNHHRNRWRGNTARCPNFHDEIVLQRSCQCVPIIKFDASMVDKNGSPESNGNELIWTYHREIQRVVDLFYNGGVPISGNITKSDIFPDETITYSTLLQPDSANVQQRTDFEMDHHPRFVRNFRLFSQVNLGTTASSGLSAVAPSSLSTTSIFNAALSAGRSTDKQLQLLNKESQKKPYDEVVCDDAIIILLLDKSSSSSTSSSIQNALIRAGFVGSIVQNSILRKTVEETVTKLKKNALSSPLSGDSRVFVAVFHLVSSKCTIRFAMDKAKFSKLEQESYNTRYEILQCIAVHGISPTEAKMDNSTSVEMKVSKAAQILAIEKNVSIQSVLQRVGFDAIQTKNPINAQNVQRRTCDIALMVGLVGGNFSLPSKTAQPIGLSQQPAHIFNSSHLTKPSVQQQGPVFIKPPPVIPPVIPPVSSSSLNPYQGLQHPSSYYPPPYGYNPPLPPPPAYNSYYMPETNQINLTECPSSSYHNLPEHFFSEESRDHAVALLLLDKSMSVVEALQSAGFVNTETTDSILQDNVKKLKTKFEQTALQSQSESSEFRYLKLGRLLLENHSLRTAMQTEGFTPAEIRSVTLRHNVLQCIALSHASPKENEMDIDFGDDSSINLSTSSPLKFPGSDNLESNDPLHHLSVRQKCEKSSTLEPIYVQPEASLKEAAPTKQGVYHYENLDVKLDNAAKYLAHDYTSLSSTNIEIALNRACVSQEERCSRNQISVRIKASLLIRDLEREEKSAALEKGEKMTPNPLQQSITSFTASRATAAPASSASNAPILNVASNSGFSGSTFSPFPPTTSAFNYPAPQWNTQKQPNQETIIYTAPNSMLDLVKSKLTPVSGPPGDIDNNRSNTCVICLSEMKINEQLSKINTPQCGHIFHHKCIMECIQYSNPRCPICRKHISDEPQGYSPSGSMTISTSMYELCDGFETSSNGTISIKYSLEGGIQKEYHSNPDTYYHSISRIAFLPDNIDGQNLLKRLKYAFSKGLTFTVGTSATSGRSNCITWSSIHHKTRRSGGAHVHGFPDNAYFTNCNDELDKLDVPSANSLS